MKTDIKIVSEKSALNISSISFRNHFAKSGLN